LQRFVQLLLLSTIFANFGCSILRSGSEQASHAILDQAIAPTVDSVSRVITASTPDWLAEDDGSSIFEGQVQEPFESHGPVTLANYMEAAVQRHPSIQSAEAAYIAAQHLHPQAVAWADPQFRFLNGPTLFGSNSGQHLWRLQAQQPISAWGKRPARGNIAIQRERQAAEDVMLADAEIRKLATHAFFDYAFQNAILPLVEAELQLAEEEWQSAHGYLVSASSTAIGTREQNELERLDLESKREEQEALLQASIARLNVLVGRSVSSAPLALDLDQLPTHSVSVDHSLTTKIIERHPAVRRAAAKCREAEAHVQLANAHFYPDLVFVTRFDTNADTFWLPERAAVRPQLGLNAIVPMNKDKVRAGVRQASAQMMQCYAEKRALEQRLQQELDEIHSKLLQLARKRSRLAEQVKLATQRAQALDQSAKIQLASNANTEEAMQKIRKAFQQSIKYERERLKAEYEWHAQVAELLILLD